MALFKCRDCGLDVDDPITHVCGLPPPKNDYYQDNQTLSPVSGHNDSYASYAYKPPPDVQARYDKDTIPRTRSPSPSEGNRKESDDAGSGYKFGFLANLFGGNGNQEEQNAGSPQSGQSKAREETMYTSSTLGPRATSMAIELSEILVYKDPRSAVCDECRNQIRKGDEFVYLENEMIHATCTVCSECGLSADKDPYGSDGWKCVNGYIKCADCLAAGQDADYPEDPNSKYPISPTSPKPPPSIHYQTCGTCRKSIIDPNQSITHPKLNGTHHANCLTCQLCTNPISVSFNENNPLHVRKAQPLCHPCYLKTLPRCGGCRNVITRDTRVCAALGKKYHPQCFSCFKCGTGFPDKSFYVYDNQPYCRRCYHELNGTICGTCDQPIEGPCACVVEGRFHPDCFVCTTCRRNLADVYYSYEKRPYCERHIAEIQRRRGGGKAERRQTYYKNM